VKDNMRDIFELKFCEFAGINRSHVHSTLFDWGADSGGEYHDEEIQDSWRWFQLGFNAAKQEDAE